MSDKSGNPRYLAFAQLLRQHMEACGLNASDLARAVWGEIKDSRGYLVARNRDRIGYYLNGTSFPEDDNLRKLADAVKLPYAELAATRTLSGPVPARIAAGKVQHQQEATYAQLNAILQIKPRMRLETALKIIELLRAEDAD